MTATLVDSSILIDIANADRVWTEWSAAALRDCRSSGELVINAIIYSEVSSAFEKIEDAELVVSERLYRREDVPWAAAFVAGQAYRRYRTRGGIRTSPLPGFFIGAHAAVCGYRLLSRDRDHFKSYFPSLHIVSPGAPR